MITFDPTCTLRLLRTRDANLKPSVKLQQWWQKVPNAADWMTQAIITGAVPEPEGEWRDVPVVEES